MILTRLGIHQFRNIDSLELSPHPRLNLITGNNGSGKSTVLESIQCLSTGHSFRTRNARELIQREAPSFTLNGYFTDPANSREHRAGLCRQRDGTVQLRLNFEEVHSMAEATRLFPVKSLTPDSHKLVQEGPDERRQFLDWGVFHMEHSYFAIWKQFKRSLSQRNQLLRENGSEKEISVWNDLLAESSENIHRFRSNYVDDLSTALERRMESMGAMFHVELHYRKGWSDEADMADVLVRNLDYHRRMKTTTDGPHRAELALLSDGVPARQLLSRGQQKVLVYLLHLSQLDLLSARDSRNAILVCDDLTSELDDGHALQLIEQLLSLKCQIFVSGVNLDTLLAYEHHMFHMEHGNVKNVV